MKKIIVFLLLVFTIFLFSTTIDYVLVVPSDVLVSEITSLIDNLESYDFKISLTDYGLSKKNYEYLYSPYDKYFKNHILILLSYFSNRDVNSDYILPLDFVSEYQVQGDLYLYSVSLFDSDLNLLYNAFNKIAYDSNNSINSEALTIYSYLSSLLNSMFEDDSPKNYDIDYVIASVYIDTHDEGYLVFEIGFISQNNRKIDLVYYTF
ncbi:hypothetical protein [Thermosipho globiformans]|uniref:hypothetical protein n=1 Tax=Thermosipho globiformans TaxID=380685 RepID=UPI000F8C457D|nr:hypothetical protein [Thermosipho globiformans]